jgi:hypothetical protein
MKVMCINEDWKTRENGDPCFGDTCTVVDSFSWGKKSIYRLKEFPHPGGYQSDAFVPLSDIDETEMVRNELEVQVCDATQAR